MRRRGTAATRPLIPVARRAVALVLTVTAALLAPVVQLPAQAAVQVWPGGQAARTVDVQGQLGTDVSGLSYRAGATRAADVLWAVDDRDGLLHRLVLTSGTWRPDTTAAWGQGKKFTFPDGRKPDAEGLVVIGGDAWVSTERDGTGVSRPSILRVPLGGTASTLGSTQEWRLASQFPGLGANVGLEAIGHVPDSHLVRAGFRDQARNALYDPAAYPGKVGGGVFFVAAEAASLKGEVRGYVLNADGSFVRVATIANPLGLAMDLEFDPATSRLWITCDNDCGGRSATAEVRSGSFVVTTTYARPTGLPNHNNEGFAIAPTSRCSGGSRPVFWSNDANNSGHALRAGTLRCDQAGVARRGAAVSVTVPDGQAGTPRRLTVRVTAPGSTPTGEVIVRVAGRTRTAALVGGRATVGVGRFATPGPRPVTVTYAGDASTAETSVVATLRTRKARTRLTPTRRAVASARGTRARVTGTLVANGLPARGQVRVRIGGRVVKATVRRSGDRIVVRTPRLTARGAVRVTLVYVGGRSTTRATAVVRVRVR